MDIDAIVEHEIDKAVHEYLEGEWVEQPRWYECGEVYYSRNEEAICRKYVGHPGRHAKRRPRE